MDATHHGDQNEANIEKINGAMNKETLVSATHCGKQNEASQIEAANVAMNKEISKAATNVALHSVVSIDNSKGLLDLDDQIWSASIALTTVQYEMAIDVHIVT